MKAFISLDLEGLPFIVNPGQLDLKGTLYEEAREIATTIVLNAVAELKEEGVEKILIADSHGPMVNIHVNSLPENVEIIRGNPRPISMVLGVDECDFALFLGYHAKFGTQNASYDHTYSSSTIHSVEVNGLPASEYILNSYVAGEYKVPIILVAGDEKLFDDVKELSPKTECVTFKTSYSRVAAKSPSLIVIQEQLQEGIKKAIKRYKDGKIKPLIAEKPVKTKITFRSSLFADIAELHPNITRIDGLAVEYITENMIDAYKIFQLLVTAAIGANAIMENMR
ncbi:MAG: M55 family metallopeptidase [Candidatus Thorarchaeota archaeon]